MGAITLPGSKEVNVMKSRSIYFYFQNIRGLIEINGPTVFVTWAGCGFHASAAKVGLAAAIREAIEA